VSYNKTENEYLVVWEDERNVGLHGTDIFGRRVEADGTVLGTNDFLISKHEGLGYDQQSHEKFPDLAWNSILDDYLVVWQDTEQDSGRGWDIYGRMVTAAGTLDGGEFRICGAAATSNEQWPAVVFNKTNNGYLVAWMDSRSAVLRGWDVYARQVAAGGYPNGREECLSGRNATADETVPDVAWNATDNRYLVAWNDSREVGTRERDVYSVYVDATGQRIGRDFRVSSGAAAGDEWRPNVAWDQGTNHFLVVRGDGRDTAGARLIDIYGRLVAG
jgi:hypothetical protein